MRAPLVLAVVALAGLPMLAGVAASPVCPPHDESAMNVGGRLYVAHDGSVWRETNGLAGLQTRETPCPTYTYNGDGTYGGSASTAADARVL